MRPTRICRCGKAFRVRADRPDQEVCSLPCRRARERAKRTSRKCHVCGAPAMPKASKCSRCAADYQRERAYRLRQELRAYKLRQGCADCGYNEHHAGLVFDHRPGTTKIKNVSVFALQGNVRATWAEVAKCDVVCGTCHAIRTWERDHPAENKERLAQASQAP